MTQFKKGDVVTVYNQSFSGKPIIEGRAKIVSPSGVDDQYRVKWLGRDLGEPMYSLRFVYPGENQTSPSAYLAKVQKEWADMKKQWRPYETLRDKIVVPDLGKR